MPLRITKAADPIEVKNITMCLYGVPGLGKTSTAFTAEKPLLLDFDHGAYRSANRGDTVQVAGWGDVTAITQADLAPYKTLVVDTAGRALDCLTADIIDRDPKAGRGGNLTLQGYGALKGAFISWLRLMRSFGLDVVLIAHSDEQRKGDELIERLDAQGSSKNEIYKSADVMGRLYLAGQVRTLNFSPTDTAFGKNPAQLPPLAVPDFGTAPGYLGTVIHSIKASLNKLSAEQQAATTALATWAERIAAAATMADFDCLVKTAKAEGAPKSVGALIAKAAKPKGFAWNKATESFDLAEEKGKAA
jgi:AAA domain